MLIKKLSNWLFPDYRNWTFWVLVAFLFKLGIFIFRIAIHPVQHDIPGFFGIVGEDTPSYFAPIENLVKNGSYLPDYRMPGYGMIYLPLILVFSKATACNLLIIFQLLLASLAVYILALSVKKVFHSNLSFYSTFYIFSISSHSNIYDASLQTESLTVSFLIITTYFFIRYFDSLKTKNLLIAGVFLAWTIFLRPVFCPLLAIYSIILFVQLIKSVGTRHIMSFLLIFSAPFILMDGLWTVRNYKCYKAIIPLTQYPVYHYISENHIGPAVKFVQAWGGDTRWWEPDAEIRWFGKKTDPPERIPLTDKEVYPPFYIYTSKFNEDSLRILKTIFTRLEKDTTMTDSSRQQNIRFLRMKFNLYITSIKQEKPMIYYVRGPLNALKRFLFYSGSGEDNIFYHISDIHLSFKYFFKVFYCVFYILILVLGFTGILLMSRDIWRLTVQSIFPIIPLYTVIIHPIILRLVEQRFFMPAFPFLIVCALYSFFGMYYMFRRLKTSGHFFRV